ncbi:hypothetical protein [Streptomyces sp. H27-H5]|nr:hypothetical protein [Streptomyces sp. H27-H5]MCY0956212.1 hypothetical protein [Streptomyces sp. H27-H5]
MTEWIDPRYADVVAELRKQQDGPDRRGPQQPVRGFIVPDDDEA